MGAYLEATGGTDQNQHKTQWEKEIAAKLICTNNPAESPFATAKAYLNLYPTMKLRSLAAFSASICNGTHRPKHGAGTQVKEAGLALTAPDTVKTAVSKLCGVRTKTPGVLTNSCDAHKQRRGRSRVEPGAEKEEGTKNGSEGKSTGE